MDYHELIRTLKDTDTVRQANMARRNTGSAADMGGKVRGRHGAAYATAGATAGAGGGGPATDPTRAASPGLRRYTVGVEGVVGTATELSMVGRTCGTADTDLAASTRAALRDRAGSPLSTRRASASVVSRVSQRESYREQLASFSAAKANRQEMAEIEEVLAAADGFGFAVAKKHHKIPGSRHSIRKQVRRQRERKGEGAVFDEPSLSLGTAERSWRKRRKERRKKRWQKFGGMSIGKKVGFGAKSSGGGVGIMKLLDKKNEARNRSETEEIEAVKALHCLHPQAAGASAILTFRGRSMRYY